MRTLTRLRIGNGWKAPGVTVLQRACLLKEGTTTGIGLVSDNILSACVSNTCTVRAVCSLCQGCQHSPLQRPSLGPLSSWQSQVAQAH